MKLVPYFAPLHIKDGAITIGDEVFPVSPRELADIRKKHYLAMLQRNPKGFRSLPGTSPKRKKPRKGRGIGAYFRKLYTMSAEAAYLPKVAS